MVCDHIISSLFVITGVFIGLLDPRWREQQNKTVGEKKQQDEIFAVGMYIWCTYVRRFNFLHTS